MYPNYPLCNKLFRLTQPENAGSQSRVFTDLETCALSLLLFTVNLHNFSFSPAVPDSQERRTTACDLRLINGSVCKLLMKTASHKSNKAKTEVQAYSMVGTELHSCDKLKALFKSQNWLAEQDILKMTLAFSKRKTISFLHIIQDLSHLAGQLKVRFFLRREWSCRLTNTKRSKTKSSGKTVPLKVHCCIVFYITN